MAGLQGSGKSTWVRAHLAATHAVVSKDHWPNARRREARQRRVVAELLGEGRSVVVDNTNPTPEDRGPLIAAARAAGVGVRAVWLDTPVPVCATRNDAREGRERVPAAGLYGTAARFVPPSTAEGFDRVDVVPPGRGGAGDRHAGTGPGTPVR
ncbi:MAG: ATP-binding protein [Actinomycetota bacterium]|nr:ATP-binding protein [Actinomycetota bacterium]